MVVVYESYTNGDIYLKDNINIYILLITRDVRGMYIGVIVMDLRRLLLMTQC